MRRRRRLKALLDLLVDWIVSRYQRRRGNQRCPDHDDGDTERETRFWSSISLRHDRVTMDDDAADDYARATP
jgi:hypothetical protein